MAVEAKLKKPRNFAVVLRGITTLDERTLGAMEKGLARGLEHAVTVAQRQYLSGPRGPATLQNVSGRLRGSISYSVTRSGAAGQGVIGRIGSNVKYARRHEFGFTGTESVRAHARALGIERKFRGEIKTNKGVFIGFKRGAKAAAELLRTGAVVVQFVKAHTRRAHTPARPFIKPALEQARTVITKAIENELKAAT